jgi:hypothetical protein
MYKYMDDIRRRPQMDAYDLWSRPLGRSGAGYGKWRWNGTGDPVTLRMSANLGRMDYILTRRDVYQPRPDQPQTHGPDVVWGPTTKCECENCGALLTTTYHQCPTCTGDLRAILRRKKRPEAAWDD